jgi:2-desacetyl-2-hydroxyethyl bacteriochlorophyllide A dehydrogenase
MTGRVLRGMEQHPQHRRGQLLAADGTSVQEGIRRGRADLHQRAVDGTFEIRNQRGRVCGRISAPSLAGSRPALLRCEPFAACIGEQPIERASQVPHVKADRCAAFADPDLFGRQSRQRPCGVFPGVEQRMRDRHEQGRDALNRTTQPCFDCRWGGHPAIIAPGMRTVVLDRPGELRLIDTHPPAPPGPDGALVRVQRVGVCGTDVHAWRGEQPFFTYPRILGHELAVEIVALGGDVNGLEIGDRCAVEPYLNCGTCRPCRIGRPNCCEHLQVLGVHRDGGMRELFEVPARKLHPAANLSDDALALVETLSIGAHAVRRAQVQPQDDVLVLGAGPIGLGVATFAAAEAGRVYVADVNANRLAFCRAHIRDVGVLDLSGRAVDVSIREQLDGRLPSVVFDATGNADSMRRAFSLIANGGTLVFVGLVLGDLSFADPDFHRRETTLLASRNALPEDFHTVIGALAAGRVDVASWISHRTSLGDAVHVFPEWTRPEAGVVKGIIVVD